MSIDVEPVALHEAARRRYLSYAMSVITARALPDVRDGLKPVQRRILYAMARDLRLWPEGRFRKSAAVVGEVMARYHPHGDQAIYDAMVRMAQPFSLLHPLVAGQGNFGSLDGDPPAAMRYTEVRLAPVARELLDELGRQTVAFRPTYDAQHSEPVVLPARYPNLLVNGSEGIAVGMATRIPPHNLREVVAACRVLIHDRDAPLDALLEHVRGPDFPTGGEMAVSPDELRRLYETGRGPVLLRGTWRRERRGRRHLLVLDSLPYGLNKASLVEQVGRAVAERRLPQVVDVRDESTDAVRVVLELRRAEDAEAAVAWLMRHTPFEQRYHVNITCLVPTGNPEVGAPAALGLREVLLHWLDFRYETLRRRLVHDLRRLEERIHLLEAFEILFDALDEAIAIIRDSEGRRDAAERLVARFDFDDVQADAVLDTRLYRLARLEIDAIRKELAEKRAEAERIRALLADPAAVWALVGEELDQVAEAHGVERRTRRASPATVAPSFDDAAYIVAEDATVFVTRDGWIKRQRTASSLAKVRVREGDAIAYALRASTRSTLTFFTDLGMAYTLLVDAVPATTGYGEPIQARFRFAAKERVVGVVSHDPRHLPTPGPEGGGAGLVAVTALGRAIRLPLAPFAEPSTRTGRRYARLDEGDAVVAAWPSDGTEYVSLASRGGHALVFPVGEIRELKAAGRGVTGIKLEPGDRVLAFQLARSRQDGARVTTTNGREEVVRARKFLAGRGGRGRVVIRRGGFKAWDRPVVARLDES